MASFGDPWEFEPDTKFLGEVLKSQDVRRILMERAELVVALARRPSPQGFRRDTGENVSSMRVYSTMGPDDNMSKKDRWVAHVEMFAPHAAVREFGTPRTPGWSRAEEVLRRVVEGMGSGDE